VSEHLEVSVPVLLDGVRVDRAVAMVAEVSRAVAAELVAAGAVLVDGQPVTTRSFPLVAGTTLVVTVPDPASGRLVAEDDVAFTVVHEDPDVVVVDKPAGLVVHPGAGRTGGTLAAGLLARYPELAELEEAGVGDAGRPGIVHRLDRGTSGLLAVARTERAYRSLTAQLAAREVERRYVALANGLLADDRGVVDAPIGRSARTPTRMAISAQGRRAATAYAVVQRFEEPPEATLVVLTLETGRTHQIRVHLAAIGHPVVGDERYGPLKGWRAGLPSGRFFLHAAVLGFEHPSGEGRLRFVAGLPEDLRLALPGAPEHLEEALGG